MASSWEEFLRVLKAQGVSRSVIASANAADRIALAEGVFPQSPRRREEVLLAWPDDPRCLYPATLPPRACHQQQQQQQSPRRASRSSSIRGARGEAAPPAHPWLSPAIARARASSRCRSRSAGRDGDGGARSRSRSHSRGAVPHAEGTPQRRRPSSSPLKRRHHHDPPLDGSGGGDSSALLFSSSLGSGSGNLRDTSLSSSRRSRTTSHTASSAAAFDRHGAARAMHASPYRSCRGALPVGTVVTVVRPPRGSGSSSSNVPAALVGAKGKTIDTVDSEGAVPVAFAPPLYEVLLPVSCLLRCAGETDVDLRYRPDPRHVGRDARWLPVDLPVALPPPPPPHAHRAGGPPAGLGLLRKAAAEAETVFGQASAEAGRAHGEVAAACLAVGDAEGAVGSARRAVDAVLGGGGGAGGLCLLREVNTLARALSDLGEGAAALDLLERTLEDNGVAEGEERGEEEAAAWASTAHNCAVLCQLRCEAARGVAAAREALQRLARLRGTAHASALLAACNLAVLLSDVGAVGEASHHAARCLRLLSAYQATPDTPLDDLKQTLLAILVDRSSHAAAAASATAASSVCVAFPTRSHRRSQCCHIPTYTSSHRS